MSTATQVRPTRMLVEVKTYSSVSSAPNGSVRNVTDYYTDEIYNEVWPEYEEKGWNGEMRRGTYAGAVYRTVFHYISGDPTHKGQYLSSSSGPWPAQ